MTTGKSVLAYLRRTAFGGVLLAVDGCVPDAVLHEDPEPTCGIAFAGECESCAAASCCSQARACAESPDCKPLADCLAACDGDVVCRTNCALDFPTNDDSILAPALAACLSDSCEEPCKLTCGQLPGLVSAAASDGCQTCLADNYCETQRACARNVDCQAYVACRQACVTGDCIGSCAIQRNPEADLCLGNCDLTDCVRPCSSDFNEVVDSYAALYASIGGVRCAKQCQSGSDWSCVGEVLWPYVEAKERILTVGFSSQYLPAIREGIRVEMCAWSDEKCKTPLDSAYTDANGIVELVDRTGSANGLGFGLNGFLKLSSEQVYPTKVYWGFPLSEPHGALGTSIPIFHEYALYAVAGGPLDPTRGLIGAVVVDCAGVPASDVEVALSTDDPAVQRVYARGTAPDRAATDTDQTGTVFFTDVPVGGHTLTVTPKAIGSASSVVPVDVQPGTLTEVGLGPTPL